MYSKPTPRRAATYIRVSSDEQVEGYSLDAQNRAVKLYSEAHGWEIIAEYRDEGKSARTDDLAKRPAFAQMLEDAEAGRFDVLVVHKLDRFARNRTVAFSALDRLAKLNVGFVSISENMDFSTPMGQLTLTMFVGMAQFYSDNLSHETKKGKQERKRQGLHNGWLPFGVKKNHDGELVPNPKTYPGLLLAYQAASEGKSDREVAQLLNERGFRSTGNRGARPFTKDTVRPFLTNRFYLGDLPDGEGGWLPGKHAPVLDEELFNAAQAARIANRKDSCNKVRSAAQTYSFSGLARCGHCGGPLHIVRNKSGARPRLYCYNRIQGEKCVQRSTFLDVYETQIEEYLETFIIPTDYQAQIMALFAQSESDYDDAASRRRHIGTRLERIKELYAWGDMERQEYQSERDELTNELSRLKEHEDQNQVFERTAALLSDIPAAWSSATQPQRNKLAHLLFERIVVENKTVAAVEPRPDFAPFFVLDFEERLKVLSGGSDGLSFATFDTMNLFRSAYQLQNGLYRSLNAVPSSLI